MNKRQIGSTKEELARRYLQNQGVKILEQNYRNRSGEVDLIGKEGNYLVFFEVKYRRNHQLGYPEEAVGYYKQRQICKVADYYCLCHNIPLNMGRRYDVLAIEGTEIRWIRNAFPHFYN